MATQTKVNAPGQVVQDHFVKSRIIWVLAAITGLVVVLVLGSVFVAVQPATVNEAGSQRSFEADAARYTALAEFHLAEDAANRQRAISAEVARHNGLARYYLSKDETGGQRALKADTARYTALAAYFAAENDNLQRGLKADAARYGALAEYYTW